VLEAVLARAGELVVVDARHFHRLDEMIVVIGLPIFVVVGDLHHEHNVLVRDQVPALL
jgi:hypothetical protein